MQNDIANVYLVGGAVRDQLMGVKVHDFDYAVEFPHLIGKPAQLGYEALYDMLVDQGFSIFVETPEYLTIRARFPKGHPLVEGEDRRLVTADFVVCRSEGQYTDGRRPDQVFAGTIYDDLARRDFTVNAMARRQDGQLLDPYRGKLDIQGRLLRCVGLAEERFREDSLRALRAMRFCITKDFNLSTSLRKAMTADWLPPLLASVSTERKREELYKCFKHDTRATMEWLMHHLSPEFYEATMSGIKLEPTMGRMR